MNTAAAIDQHQFLESVTTEKWSLEKPVRRSIEGSKPDVLADIYQENINIAVWQRELSSGLALDVSSLLSNKPTLQTSMTVTAKSVYNSINETLGASAYTALSKDIARLVDMFCCLFDLKRVGLRLTALNRAMCPKFHVDRVPCRLVTTYQGSATDWLPHHLIDRTKLGSGSLGKTDEESGLFCNPRDIHHLKQGDVALLKGELWEGNEGAGLVHRSPAVLDGERRLLLTLDFIGD